MIVGLVTGIGNSNPLSCDGGQLLSCTLQETFTERMINKLKVEVKEKESEVESLTLELRQMKCQLLPITETYSCHMSPPSNDLEAEPMVVDEPVEHPMLGGQHQHGARPRIDKFTCCFKQDEHEEVNEKGNFKDPVQLLEKCVLRFQLCATELRLEVVDTVKLCYNGILGTAEFTSLFSS